ncbi:5'/3'-nucleotidase SurE [Marinicella rhabdoformis]|uniref:5'/3'-nucleotidase SurE n=1 Tax=Marinicella rhabdoformis TaxID=2580566 RepID=UPI0012AED470|nr:5'/3'-nucleotidase SurE [Marinicella rhabdoformis]
MKFLVSNDDGVHAKGIKKLSSMLKDLGDVVVFAPNRDRSGASNSLTLDRPIRVEKVEPEVYSVYGTPTDCVHLAVTGVMEDEPDMVVSGINNSANLGDDVLYSGTVAAAIEGRYLGLPAVAASIVVDSVKGKRQKRNYDTVTHFLKKIIQHVMTHPLPQDTILNVNVPNLEVDEIKGVKITRLGNRHKAENAIPITDPRGFKMYWIGPAGPEADAGEGTDFHAVKNGYVSISPIQTDMTKHDFINELGTWANHL